MTERPWMKFFPGDWRADPKLRSCSIAARGMWMEMVCIMHEATPRGSFVVNGKPVTPAQMLGLMGITPDDAAALLGELEDAGVFSRDPDGTIFSRRMRREEKRITEAVAHGRLGGNPILKGGVKGRDNGEANPYIASGSGLIEGTETVKEEASTRAGELDRLEGELREAAGLTNSVSTGLFDLSPIAGLLKAGYDLRTDILPKLRAAAHAGKTPSTWAYYVPAIIEGKAKNAGITPKATSPPGRPTVWLTDDDPRFLPAARHYERDTGKPPTIRGSRFNPGQGFPFPAEYLEQIGA